MTIRAARKYFAKYFAINGSGDIGAADMPSQWARSKAREPED
jgi:hypothetical protein